MCAMWSVWEILSSVMRLCFLEMMIMTCELKPERETVKTKSKWQQLLAPGHRVVKYCVNCCVCLFSHDLLPSIMYFSHVYVYLACQQLRTVVQYCCFILGCWICLSYLQETGWHFVSRLSDGKRLFCDHSRVSCDRSNHTRSRHSW